MINLHLHNLSPSLSHPTGITNEQTSRSYDTNLEFRSAPRVPNFISPPGIQLFGTGTATRKRIGSGSHAKRRRKKPHTCKSYQEPVSISCQPLQANAHHHLQRQKNKQTNKTWKKKKKMFSEVTKITRQREYNSGTTRQWQCLLCPTYGKKIEEIGKLAHVTLSKRITVLGSIVSFNS